MLRWLIHFLGVVLWGKPRKPDVPVNVGSNRITGWTYGNVSMNVYLNRTMTGKPYFKVTFRKLVGKGAEQRVGNSFFIDDLADVERCIARIRAWLRDNEALS